MNKIINKHSSGVYLLMACLLVCSCSSSAPVKPKTDTVVIKDMKFTPDTISVNKGDTIIWVNRDMMAHDVTEINSSWTSGPIAEDSSWKMTVTDEAAYYCSIHVVMKGSVELK